MAEKITIEIQSSGALGGPDAESGLHAGIRVWARISLGDPERVPEPLRGYVGRWHSCSDRSTRAVLRRLVDSYVATVLGAAPICEQCQRENIDALWGLEMAERIRAALEGGRG